MLRNRPIGHLELEVKELAPLYRIWLAPVNADADCCQVEDTLVDRLREHPDAFQFLGNGDKNRKYHPRPSPIVRITDAPPLIGLSSHVTDELVGAAAEVECAQRSLLDPDHPTF